MQNSYLKLKNGYRCIFCNKILRIKDRMNDFICDHCLVEAGYPKPKPKTYPDDLPTHIVFKLRRIR